MEEKRSVKVALLGLGTVGGGVYKLLERQKEELIDKAGASLELVKILVHNMKKERTGVDASLLTDKWEEIIEDPRDRYRGDGRYRAGQNHDSGSAQCGKERGNGK